MASVGVSVDSRAFQAGFLAAIEELKGRVDLIVGEAGARGAERARELAPKRTGALAASIHSSPLSHGRAGPFVIVSAGTREALPMEFGTYKDQPQPFMRPAAASLAGILRSGGYAARVQSSQRTKLFARRVRARAVVREQRRGGALTSLQARGVSRQISQTFRYRAPRQRR